jgi:hypothetical protein
MLLFILLYDRQVLWLSTMKFHILHRLLINEFEAFLEHFINTVINLLQWNANKLLQQDIGNPFQPNALQKDYSIIGLRSL